MPTEPTIATDDQNEDQKPLPLRAVIGSIMAAGLGVQSSRNHVRDLARGSARQYIVVGLVFTILFALTVFGAVKLILHFAPDA